MIYLHPQLIVGGEMNQSLVYEWLERLTLRIFPRFGTPRILLIYFIVCVLKVLVAQNHLFIFEWVQTVNPIFLYGALEFFLDFDYYYMLQFQFLRNPRELD